MLTRLADLVGARPRLVVALTVLAAVLAGVAGSSVFDRLQPYKADDPESESVRAIAQIERATGLDAAPGIVALVRADGPVRRDREALAAVREVERVLEAAPEIGQVRTLRDRGGEALVSRDGRATQIPATFRDLDDLERQEAARRLAEELRAEVPGVAVGGAALGEAEINRIVEEDILRAELIAVPIIFVLAFVFFRSLVSALLPPLVGGLAILGTFLGLRIAAELTDVSVFAVNVVTGLGLGLAIDYSLLIVSRYREEIAEHGPGREALRRTVRTAGATVLVSAVTVSAAMASLLVFPQRFLYSMGIGGAIVSLVAALVALVALPAILALLGPRVNALAPRRLRSRAEREAAVDRDGRWYRLAQLIARRPWRVAIPTAVLLLVIGAPFLRVEFTGVDQTVLPVDNAARQASDAIGPAFGAGTESPMIVAAATTPGPELDRYLAELRRIEGVAGLAGVERVDDDLTVVRAFLEARGVSEEAQAAVERVRGLDPPFEALVAGRAADFLDTEESLAAHLPLALLIIAATSFAALFLLTGSVVLPLKALVMNVLGLSAVFGLLVLVFQDGRLEGFLGYTSQGGLELTQPILLCAVAFGLSTDYGVFLLARIKEERDAGHSNREAVARGLERTGRIVTAAAVLFCVAFGAFATSRIIFIKEVGVGTALAVIIDATIIRALLVPALMELLGERNWWAPRPLRRVYDRFGVREDAGAAPAAPRSEPAAIG